MDYNFRTITPHCHRLFAEISGDKNPLHMNPLEARRMIFGAPVVHGIHSLLRCLDAAVRKHPEVVSLQSLRASFELPIGIDQQFTVEFDGDVSSLRFRVISCDGVAVRGRFSFGPAARSASIVPRPQFPSAWADLGPENIDGRAGELRLGLAPEKLISLFPNLADRFDPGQIAAILAVTRLVGMECPGLHSIFGGLTMRFDADRAVRPMLAYRVTNWVPRNRMLQISVDCGHATGSIDCFHRPAPISQAGFAEIRRGLAHDEFIGVRALIVGGSRGLGEVTAKVLAGGGANVDLTYAVGAMDADNVVDDIVRHGGRARAFEFDVTAPRIPDRQDERFTHVFFFATPRFSKSTGSCFNFRQFEKYTSYYVIGMSKTIDALRSSLEDGAVFCLPSTKLIDTAEKEFREFIAAKCAAEAAATHMTDRSLRIESVRLPRLRTDQTNSLSGPVADDAIPVISALVRQMVAIRRQD